MFFPSIIYSNWVAHTLGGYLGPSNSFRDKKLTPELKLRTGAGVFMVIKILNEEGVLSLRNHMSKDM